MPGQLFGQSGIHFVPLLVVHLSFLLHRLVALQKILYMPGLLASDRPEARPLAHTQTVCIRDR